MGCLTAGKGIEMWLSQIKVHKSWNEFLTDNVKAELESIEQKVGNNYTPQSELVLRFMEMDIDSIKVAILGQDPYKPAGIANGRAFQPSNLTNWGDTFRQVSLKNIVRAIYTAYNEIEEYEDIPNYSTIVSEIESGEFKLKQPVEWFNSLEKQGVLFLNTSLTCKIGESNSHEHIWRSFIPNVLRYIAKRNPDIIWFLWGKSAIDKLQYIGNIEAKAYVSNHPMMCSIKYKEDFLKNPCFKNTMGIIDWLG